MVPPEPKLDEAAAAFAAADARFVVIGGFAVIANRFVRATEDVDFLIPDDPENDRRIVEALRALGGLRMRDEAPLDDDHLVGRAHLRALTSAGIVDLVRGGLPPLDFDTVAGEAMNAVYDGLEFPVAGLRSIVGFKRLAGRPRDRNDLAALEEIHGELPNDPLPGLDG